MMEDTRLCCNPFPCPYNGKNGKPCEECNCYRDDYWDEDGEVCEKFEQIKEDEDV